MKANKSFSSSSSPPPPPSPFKSIMQRTIEQQQAKMDTYWALKEKKLPIPPDLKAEVEAHLKETE